MKPRFIGCIPCYDSPLPPVDQFNCIKQPCMFCQKEMWVSEKKRTLIKKKPREFKVFCWPCIAFYCMQGAITESGVEKIDINQMNGFNN